MQRTDRVVRYVGRHATADDRTAFDDETLPATLAAALASAKVLLIDDPMSFPWDSLDADLPQVLVIDTTRCIYEDFMALNPALDHLTPADTILDPPRLIRRHPYPLSENRKTRSVAPDEKEWDTLFREKQLHRSDRAIRERATREVGADAVLHRITTDDLTRSGRSMAEYLDALSAESDAEVVGVWGVRTEPGAPLNHGWAVFEPRAASGR